MWNGCNWWRWSEESGWQITLEWISIWSDHQNELVRLENGYYKQEHDFDQWKWKLKSIHKTDYVLSYYSRSYGLRGLHGDIGQILATYVGDEELDECSGSVN